ncbi:hypothetical protein HRG_000703 [Hirsutella rhossiliensis]|uniref:WW domain-containing protein n=1 Tax=Hirsutella rhossiliensis TaxID=111463 RepID=A0A9P8SPC1_9HYPO|nr:uncharacterized protein HRG_00703 [Hirsutella rhossiliensis]KAH0968061.1 hypothetical protein HRG_00703 [Hirsutella rhossiliensis]
MVGLPPGWEADYDGRRWFYTYRPTGHAQYSFPSEGDEFPHFVDASAPAPDLAPEERHESEQQVRRQSEGGGGGGGNKPQEPAGQPRMSATAAHPVSNLWEADFKIAAHELLAEVSPPPPPVFDPVGIVAEMPTEHTPVSRIEMHPEPAELGDNSILAPVERVASPSDQQQGLHQPSSEAGQQPSYQPYTPDPDSTYLRPDKRKSQSAFLQRDVSLMLSLKLPGNLEPNTVPRVLSPPQMPPKVPPQHEAPRQDAFQTENAPLATEPVRSDGQGMSLQRPAQSTTPPDSQSSFQPGHERTQSQGALSKFPSVLKPARGRIAVTPSQQQSLSSEKRSSAPSSVSWKTTWEATPPPPLTAPPAYVPYQKGPDDQTAPQPQKAWQAEEPLRQAGVGIANPSLRQSSPCTPPRRGPGSAQQQPGSTGTASPEQGLRRASPRSVRDVSPIRSGSASLSSRHPIRTPSPVEPFPRGSSNASPSQGANGASYTPASVHHTPGSAPRMATQDRTQGNRGPTVPDKIPLEHMDGSYFPSQMLGRGGQSQGRPDASSSSLPLRYPPEEYPIGFQVKSNLAQRRTGSPASQKGVPGAQQSNHQTPLSTPHDSAASTPNYKLGRIEEDGERGAVAKAKIVAQNAVPISVASSTQPSPPARISSLQAYTFSVSAGVPTQGDANSQMSGQTGSPPREQHPEHSKTRIPSDSTLSSQGMGMPSIRLVQSREGPHAVDSGSFGQPLQSHPIGKTPVYMVEPLQGLPAAPAPGPGASKLAGMDKEKKWTKWFKSSRLSRSQKEQAHFGQMLGAGNANQLPTRPADGQIV